MNVLNVATDEGFMMRDMTTMHGNDRPGTGYEEDIMMTNMLDQNQNLRGDDEQSLGSGDGDEVSIASTGRTLFLLELYL